MREDGAGQRRGIAELAPARPVGADKIGIAKAAGRICAILFQRLQPAKRRKTAARPACAPSP
jgi:hypothetical protein